MDQRAIDNAVERHITRLRVVALAFWGSMGMYVVLAVILQGVLGLGVLAEIPFPLAAGIAVVQLLIILAGYLISRAMRDAGRAPRGGPDDADAALQRYTSSVIVASAMREVAATVGLVLTLLTGDLTWVIALAGVAMFSALVHWPRREAVRDFLQQQRLMH